MAPIGPVKRVTITNPHFSPGDSGVERISIATKTTERAVSTNQVRIIPLNIWNSHNASSERRGSCRVRRVGADAACDLMRYPDFLQQLLESPVVANLVV